MRKVELSMEQNNKYEVIKKLVETKGNKKTASVRLRCTLKTINNMIKGYAEMGKEFFVHGNKGRKPSHTIPEETKKMLIDLYKNKYYDTNIEHFNELIRKYENIEVSYSLVRKTLLNECILSPKAIKRTRKRIKKLLEEKQQQHGITENEKNLIAKKIVDIEDAHPRRPRSAYFGELLQMDASEHIWFGTSKMHLHVAIDDCTGQIVGAYFDTAETLNGYYNVFYQILTNYGIPFKFLTDRRTVFEYKKKNILEVEHDTLTQFGYACQQLGTEIATSSVAQAKGRVERLFETLQSRLPVELRLAGVTDIDAANVFLLSYVKEYNAKFALPIDDTKSVFEKQPSISQINLMLAVIAERKIDDGHCIRFDKKYFKLVDDESNPVYFRKGTASLVIKSFDGKLYSSIEDKVYLLEEIPVRMSVSKNFDTVKTKEEINKSKAHTPKPNHYWKEASFKAYLKKQTHLKDKLA